MGNRVVAVGIAVLDKIFGVAEIPTQATKVFANSYAEIGGGPAATAAVAIARLGGQAELWARVGDDPVGRRIIEELRDWGVVTQIALIASGASSVSGVLVDDKGERLIVAFADPDLDSDPSWLPLDRINSADAVVADVRWPRATEVALRRAREAGVPSVLDADLAPGDISGLLLPLADYAVFSQPALRALAGTADPAEGLRLVEDRCRGLVGVTIGSEGFLWLEAGELQREPGFKVHVVDTLGAGDVFHGAFALAIAEGRDVRTAARFANAASALKCSRTGGRAGIPAREEVESLLASPDRFLGSGREDALEKRQSEFHPVRADAVRNA